MSATSAMRETLATGDVPRLMSIWGAINPAMPQPESYEEGEVILHQARTSAESVALEKRLYSHAFLDERGYPSGLPDALRPPRERKGPSVIFSAVLVAVGTTSTREDRRQEARAIEAVMSQAAGEMVSSGILDRDRIVAHMWQARDNFIKSRYRIEL